MFYKVVFPADEIQYTCYYLRVKLYVQKGSTNYQIVEWIFIKCKKLQVVSPISQAQPHLKH